MATKSIAKSIDEIASVFGVLWQWYEKTDRIQKESTLKKNVTSAALKTWEALFVMNSIIDFVIMEKKGILYITHANKKLNA